MIKLVYCIRRHPALKREEFHKYWVTAHAGLVKSHAEALGAVRYIQSHTIDSELATASNEARASSLPPFDGITEFWWQDLAAMSPEGTSPEAMIEIQKQLLEDERTFIDLENSVIFLTEEHTIYDRDTH
jgi:hypothetical protein